MNEFDATGVIKGSHCVEGGEKSEANLLWTRRLFESLDGASSDKTSSIGAARGGSREKSPHLFKKSERARARERERAGSSAYPTGTVGHFGLFYQSYSSVSVLLARLKETTEKKKSTVVLSAWNINTERGQGEGKKKKSSSFAFHEICFFFRRGLDIRDLAD